MDGLRVVFPLTDVYEKREEIIMLTDVILLIDLVAVIAINVIVLIT